MAFIEVIVYLCKDQCGVDKAEESLKCGFQERIRAGQIFLGIFFFFFQRLIFSWEDEIGEIRKGTETEKTKTENNFAVLRGRLDFWKNDLHWQSFEIHLPSVFQWPVRFSRNTTTLCVSWKVWSLYTYQLYTYHFCSTDIYISKNRGVSIYQNESDVM